MNCLSSLTMLNQTTESWLHGVKPGQPPSPAHVKSSKVFPDNYVAYRNDRSSFGGGVFILVKDNLVSTEEQRLVTNCEIEWVKVKLPRNKDFYIGNFYMPHRNIKELDSSLQQLFNTPNLKKHYTSRRFQLRKYRLDQTTCK